MQRNVAGTETTLHCQKQNCKVQNMQHPIHLNFYDCWAIINARHGSAAPCKATASKQIDDLQNNNMVTGSLLINLSESQVWRIYHAIF